MMDYKFYRSVLVKVLFFILIGLLSCKTTLAQEEESEEELPPPGKVLLRSAIIPGWGQLANKKYLKAIGFFGANSYFVYKFFDMNQNIQQVSGEEKEQLEYNRNTWAWRFLAGYLLCLTDAYVDAQLAGFPEDEEDFVDLDFAPVHKGFIMNLSVSF